MKIRVRVDYPVFVTVEILDEEQFNTEITNDVPPNVAKLIYEAADRKVAEDPMARDEMSIGHVEDLSTKDELEANVQYWYEEVDLCSKDEDAWREAKVGLEIAHRRLENYNLKKRFTTEGR